MATTTRLSLRYPTLSDTADVPRDIGNLASDIDKAAIFSKGTFASRPTSTVGSPGIDGRYYFATDTSRLYLDTGTSWVEVASGNESVTSTMIAAGAVTASKLGSASGIISNIQSTTVTSTVTTSITTGGTFYDVSGLSVSITPSSSGSKVLAWFTFNGSCDTQDRVLYCRLVRGSTAIGIGDAAGSRPRATAASYQTGVDSANNPTSRQVTGIYLDSPATTSATTYKIQASLNVSSTTLYTNRSGPADSDSTGFPRQVCTITVAEVA